MQMNLYLTMTRELKRLKAGRREERRKHFEAVNAQRAREKNCTPQRSASASVKI